MMREYRNRSAELDVHERRFLTTSDLAYLEEIELALVRVHGVPAERAGEALRPVARELQRHRTRGDRTAAAPLLAYGGAAGHAEVIAALLIAPRAPKRSSLALLALLAAVAGLLGMRVVLALAFRRSAPVRIGWVDLTLVIAVVAVILGAARSRQSPDRFGRIPWLGVSLVLGVALGLSATALLRALDVRRTIVTLPLWLAAALAVACGMLTWLLTWPDDQPVYQDRGSH
jgi:hypothetical protein